MATQTDHLPAEATGELSSAAAPYPNTLERPTPEALPTPAPLPHEATPASSSTTAAAIAPPPPPRPSWWALGAAVILAIVVAAASVWWVMAQRLPDIDPQQVIARNLADAEQALEYGRYIDPPERSALHYYSTVLAVAPDNPAAQAGLDTIAQRFITDARVLLADRRIAEAGVAMEKARRVRPGHAALTPLEEQLRTELRRLVANTQSADDTAGLPPITSRPSAASAASTHDRPTATTPSPANDRPIAATERRNALPPSGETVRAPSETPPITPATSVRSSATPREPAPASVSTENVTGNRPTAPSTPPALAAAVTAPATSPDAPVPLAAPPVAPPAVNITSAAPTGSGPVVERKLVKMVQPTYPQDAVMRGLEGWVDVRMQVNAEGAVLRPQVVHTEGGRVFNRPALQAVQQWQYEARPGAQSQDMQVRIEFKLTQ